MDGHRIRALTLTGSGVVTTVAGTGLASFKDGSAKAASFNSPTGLAVDSAGVIYVADQNNHRIRMITPGARGGYTVATLAGVGVASMKNGPAVAAGFNMPTGVAVNAAGTEVFVADTVNHSIRVVTKGASGWTVSTAAGVGSVGFTDGLGDKAKFNNPESVSIYEAGSALILWVADRYNNRVRRIERQGGASVYSVSTSAGWGIPGYQNGSGTIAKFNLPRGVAASKYYTGVYVADTGNRRLRFVTDLQVSASVSTVAGCGSVGSEDGAAGAASFTELRGAVVTGKLVVLADATRIRALHL